MDRRLGAVSFLSLPCVPCVPVGLLQGLQGLQAAPLDLNRQTVAKNLLVILQEVENRLQEEKEVVEGFSSKLLEHAPCRPSPCPSPRSSPCPSPGSRALRSIWSDPRALDELQGDPTEGLADAAGTVEAVSGGGKAAGVGCGDWHALPAPPHHVNQTPCGRAHVQDGAAGRPSWLTGSSYKYFLGKPGAHPMDRPLWLSQAAVPPGHPLGPPLRPPPWTEHGERSDWLALSKPSAATYSTCGVPSGRRPSVASCPEYRRVRLGVPPGAPPVVPLDAPQGTRHGTAQGTPQGRPLGVTQYKQDLSEDSCASDQQQELQEVYKNERVSPLGASGSSEPDLLEGGPVTKASGAEGLQDVLFKDGDLGVQDSAWLVDAVLLLKEYYLKRAQLCLQTNISASCHQLAERDMCSGGSGGSRDVGVGDGLASTAEGWVGTESGPRSEVCSRATQTTPVLCEPIHKDEGFRWVASDRLQPDVAFYVSCFSEADDGKLP